MNNATLSFLGLSFFGAIGTVLSSTQPNFVIIIGDDCSYSDLNIYGGQNTKTPNLHALAKEGMIFNQCFQAAPMSSPTRHCLYTGVYPVRSGAYPNHTFCKDDIKSFVQYFVQQGIEQRFTENSMLLLKAFLAMITWANTLKESWISILLKHISRKISQNHFSW